MENPIKMDDLGVSLFFGNINLATFTIIYLHLPSFTIKNQLFMNGKFTVRAMGILWESVTDHVMRIAEVCHCIRLS